MVTWRALAALCLAFPAAAAEPPYPASRIRMTWDAAAVRIADGSGDNWPITWGDDDQLYTSFGDGNGFGGRSPRLSLGMARIVGDPPDHHGEDIPSDADTPHGGGANGIKASGLLMVNGTLYMFVRNYKVDGDFKHSRLAWSSDHGKSWTWADWHFSGTFGCPEFVQFGRNYQGARDGYVYIVSQDNDSAYEYSPRIVMARVPKERVHDRAAYEFYAGANTWSRDIGRREPIFTDPRGTQRIAITYNAARRRYFLTTSHRNGNETHTAALGVFDAPEPWGPWTTLYYDDHWSGNNRTYHHKFPTKWMSRNGKSMWLLYSGLGGGNYGFCLRKANLDDDVLARYARPDAPGASVMVVRKGKVILKKATGLANLEERTPATTQTNYRLASVTKQFTAMAIMMLVERGKVSYDDPLTRFFPGFPSYGREIKVRHLLNHTSGLKAYEELIPAGTTAQLHDNDVLRLLTTQDSTYFPPGSQYRYSNSGYAVLALIVEKVSGMPFAQFLKKDIFDALGMAGTVAFEEGISTVPRRAFGYSERGGGFERTDQSLTSAVLGDGGIYSSVEDLYQWDQALYGTRLVGAKTLAEAFTPVLNDYGFGWTIDRYRGAKATRHAGDTIGFSTAIARYPERQCSVIVLLNRGGANPWEVVDQLMELCGK